MNSTLSATFAVELGGGGVRGGREMLIGRVNGIHDESL